MTREDLLQREAGEVTVEQYPDAWRWEQVALPLSYHFEPGHEQDGVTLKVPAALLRQIPAERLDWLVPGLIFDKCVALVRGLPKSLRRNFVPVPDFVRAALERMPFGQGHLGQTLGRELSRMTGTRLDESVWDDIELEAHLRMRIEVVDAEGKVIAAGRDHSALCSQLAGQPQAPAKPVQPAQADTQARPPGEYALPVNLVRKQAGFEVTFWPAWAEQGDQVVEQLFDTQIQAEQAHRRGVQRLLLQAQGEQARFLRQKLPALKEAAIYYRDWGNQQQLTEDVLLASIDRVFLAEGEPLPRDPEALADCLAKGRAQWVPAAEGLAAEVLALLKQWHALQKRLKGKIDLAWAVALTDIRGQLEGLVFKHFVRDVPAQWLGQYSRYLQAIEQRLDKLPGQVQRDRVWTGEIQQLVAQYQAREHKHRQEGRWDGELQHWRWLLEEYRVSLFAQQLGTRYPVSAKRLAKLWQEIAA